ncbi:hypothetical protein [Rhodopila globiformis]|uniref:Uncharacterized protein n=1 Tax=Rhodopila globiformis TaxID=1071 RepID=A0A2S6N427_RHOGL|nr:hypothetical protein [Rhodopila globiformis]PPQ29327.1 hypothetical protein CCS01_21875 [Rhodopila globiformis]
MRQRVILSVIAIAAIGLGHVPAPALARGGGGGHAGFGAHGIFAARSGFGRHAGLRAAAGGFVLRGGGRAPGGAGFARRSRFAARPIQPEAIQPEVIVVPPVGGTGAIVPPFTGPIVMPFGAGVSTALNGGFPGVVTSFAAPLASGPPDAARAREAARRSAAGDGGASSGSQPSRSLTACYPIPNGYHCNWPS